MKRLDVDAIVRLSSQLSIINQDTGAVSPWVMNDEQKEALRLVVDNPRAIVLKGRQIGMSTVMLLLVLTFAITNPGVPACIVADTRDKAQGLLGRLAGWCAQLGIDLVEKNKGSITLANGSVIDALSAVSRADGGESRVGRSKSYGLIHCSELAFWLADAAVFRGLTSTALPGARLVVESTASAADNLFRQLWADGDGSEWERVFLSMERHEAYRRDPADIDDETWEMLQGVKYGFTRRDAAAWWWLRMRTDFGGDEQGALREFPVIPAHCFSFARGRWIMRYREVQPEAEGSWEKDRFSGWHHYECDRDEPVCFGVDVAAGHGGDSSALVVLGLLTGTIHATWMDHNTSLPDYIELIKDAGEKYKPEVVVVEFNGVGIPVYEALDQMSDLHVEKQISGAEKHYRLQRLKMAIEMGVVPIGPELVSEAKSSRIEPPKGPKGQPSYEGRDDGLNALSFAREWYLARLPTSSPVDPSKLIDHERVFHSSQRMKRKGVGEKV